VVGQQGSHTLRHRLIVSLGYLNNHLLSHIINYHLKDRFRDRDKDILNFHKLSPNSNKDDSTNPDKTPLLLMRRRLPRVGCLEGWV
jgi:hypothetical protein